MTITMTKDQCEAFIISNGRGVPALFEARCLYSTGLVAPDTVDAFIISTESAVNLSSSVAIACSASTTFKDVELLALLPNATLVEAVTP